MATLLQPGDILLPGGERVISITTSGKRGRVVISFAAPDRRRSNTFSVDQYHTFEVERPSETTTQPERSIT